MTDFRQLEPFDPRRSTDQHDALGQRLARALETPPSFTIPESFAARTASLAAASSHATRYSPRAMPVRSLRYSTLAAYCAFAALTLAMIFFTPFFAPSAATTQQPALPIILLAVEFVALTTWLSLRASR